MNPLAPPRRFDSDRILRASGSSFAAAFRLLPADRRRDLATLYAFCRTADDIADLGDYDTAARRNALQAWREAFHDPGLHGVPDDLRSVMHRRALPADLFIEMLDGIAADLEQPVRMATRRDLDAYCHRVAGVVGLLCLPIFGADAGRSAEFAETLGRALQYTNILRDTASDLKRDRLYYPADELAAAGLDAGNFAHETEARQAYLQTFAAQTEVLFAQAASLEPPPDRQALRPARVMAMVYTKLLRTMQSDGLRVLERRYRLTRLEKVSVLATVLLARQ